MSNEHDENRNDEKIEEEEELREIEDEIEHDKGGVSLFGIFFRVMAKIFQRFLHLLSQTGVFLYNWKKSVAVVVFVVVPLFFLFSYLFFDTAEFSQVDENFAAFVKKTDISDEKAKGIVLSRSITFELERELSSFFGWSVNDLLFMPTRWFDNRANRQKGVIFATRMFQSFFSTNNSKFGKGQEEHSGLRSVRDTYFAYQPTKFWFPSSESQYRKGIKEMRGYENDLKKGKATYNMRSDDLYNFLSYTVSENFLGEPLGKLNQHNDDISFFDVDDHIYYAQGVVLVVRDVVYTLTKLYPEILDKGGKENLESAMRDMNLIATFNPFVVLGARHDSMFPDHRTKMTKYLFTLVERLRDVAESINR